MSDGSTRLAAALADRYRIERELGAGGMATVYLAHDARHDRKVAIKVLKPELAAVLGAERFVQEIKTTAAMSHPHILPLFDSGTADGFLYYVMPYIMGETIREKLNREGQFGIEEAVKVTTAVADALDYAHRHGVIHRDIKPENILLHDGRPMVMDFGIALAVSAAAGGRMTETGLSLGTPHYMSPEQATADKQVTARSDVYSLASVLYEMLTGEPPHMGTSAQQIIMKIIAEPVRPATELRKAVPPNVAAALAQALEKLPADRFESAKAFADALGDRSFQTGMTTATTRGRPESRRGWQLVSAALALTTLASLGVAIASRERAPRAGLSRYEVLLGGDAAEDVRPILSPSGEWVGWASEGGPLMLRRRGATAAVAIPGTIGALIVAFSPDDSAIAFASLRSLHVVPLSGGTPNQLADVGSPFVAWGPDGWIYFTNRDRGISRIRSGGGRPEEVVRPDSLARLLGASQVLPDGAGSLLLSIAERSNRATVAVWDGRTRELTRLTEGVAPTFLAPGYLVFARRDSTLWGARFELRRHQMVGEPVQLESGVVGGPLPAMALSAEGTLLYRSGGQSLSGRLSRIGRDGRVSPLALESEGWFRGVRVSPDGRRLAFGTWSTASRSFIRLHDLSIGSTRDLIPGWNTYDPVWSLDGKRVAFHSSERTDRDSGGPGGEYRGFDVAIGAEMRRRGNSTGDRAWSHRTRGHQTAGSSFAARRTPRGVGTTSSSYRWLETRCRVSGSSMPRGARACRAFHQTATGSPMSEVPAIRHMCSFAPSLTSVREWCRCLNGPGPRRSGRATGARCTTSTHRGRIHRACVATVI